VSRAQGESEAAVLRAKGLATARLAMAEAEAQAISRIASSLPEGQAAMYLLGMKYLEALPQLTQGKGSTIFLPAEAAGVMGALGGIKELLVRSSSDVPMPSTPRQPAPAYTPPRTQIPAPTFAYAPPVPPEPPASPEEGK
jgi:hypothetical protein